MKKNVSPTCSPKTAVAYARYSSAGNKKGPAATRSRLNCNKSRLKGIIMEKRTTPNDRPANPSTEHRDGNRTPPPPRPNPNVPAPSPTKK